MWWDLRQNHRGDCRQNSSRTVSKVSMLVDKLKVMTLVDVEGEDKGVLKGFIMGGETINLISSTVRLLDFFGQIFMKSTKWITEKFGMDLISQPRRRVQPGNLTERTPGRQENVRFYHTNLATKAISCHVSLKIKVELVPLSWSSSVVGPWSLLLFWQLCSTCPVINLLVIKTPCSAAETQSFPLPTFLFVCFAAPALN